MSARSPALASGIGWRLPAIALFAALASEGCVSATPSGAATRAASATPTHPLDPLTEGEIATAVAALRAGASLPPGTLFPILTLNEPPKEEVLAFRAGARMRREARIVAFDRAANRTHEAIVDLAGRTVLTWREVPGVQPQVLLAEFDSIPERIHADPRWQAAMRRRGITDFENVYSDVWAPGPHAGSPATAGARVVRAVSFYRGDRRNAYGRPIEGVVTLFDANRNQVIAVEDAGVVPVAPAATDLDPRSLRPLRELRPLQTVQPRGPSFTVDGTQVSWDRWRFRYAVHPREGLVLYQVGIQDSTGTRSVLYRASLSEMVVPYGDPAAAWSWRSAFDEGEYGLGRCITSLTRGGEVPEHGTLHDAVLADETGAPSRQRAVVGIYEQDGGVLWRHYDDESEHLDVRRARELVVVSWFTIGNYDYGLRWTFGQDGSLDCALELSGILLAKGVRSTSCPTCAPRPDGTAEPPETRFGTLVDRGILAPNHQHFASMRLDFDVEDTANSVLELNTRGFAAGGVPRNGNAFVVERKALATEAEARRSLNLTSSRRWLVIGPRTNALGHRTGYVLAPGGNAVPYARPGSSLRRRASFVDHHLWVTRYRPEERYAAGDYPNQRAGGDGLERYSNRESLGGEDLVLWYTFAITHAPRAEEWPVMSVHEDGFRLHPHGFFTRNPALDVAPVVTAASTPAVSR